MDMVQIVVAVGTVLTSGVVSAVVTYKLNRAKEESFFMRKKAEELYMAVDEFGRAFSVNMLAFLPLLEGKIDYNQMLDVQIGQDREKRHGGLELVEMLIGIYFPAVQPKLTALLEAREKFSAFRAAHKQAYLDDLASDPAWRARFGLAVQRVETASAELKTAVIAAGQKYA